MAQPGIPPVPSPSSGSSQDPEPSPLSPIPGPPDAGECGATSEPLALSAPERAPALERLKKRLPESAPNFLRFDSEPWLGPGRYGKRERLKYLLLNGQFIILLLAVGAILWGFPGAFFAPMADFGSSLVALAMCFLSFRLRLIARYVIAALMVPGIVIFLVATPLGKPVYDAGLLALNSVTDPSERSFWVDPDYRDVPGYEDMPDWVFVETDDGIQRVDTTTEAGRDLAMWGIKTDLGERYLRTLGRLLGSPAMFLACLGVASRLMGITRAPRSIADRPGLFDGLSRRTRVGLILMTLGFAFGTAGAGLGDLLDAIFDDRLYYLPGQGVNREALGVAFTLMFLYKAKWLGYMALWLGVILLLTGTPRRKLFAWYDRRALNGGRRSDPPLKKTGTWLFSIGILGAVVQYYGVTGFFLGTGREILLMTTGDLQVLHQTPGWFRTIDTVLGLWALSSFLGMIFIAAGSKTVRRIIAAISLVTRGFGSSGSNSGSGSSTSSPSSGSDTGGSSDAISGGAAQAGQAAEAARGLSGGGRGS